MDKAIAIMNASLLDYIDWLMACKGYTLAEAKEIATYMGYEQENEQSGQSNNIS